MILGVSAADLRQPSLCSSIATWTRSGCRFRLARCRRSGTTRAEEFIAALSSDLWPTSLTTSSGRPYVLLSCGVHNEVKAVALGTDPVCPGQRSLRACPKSSGGTGCSDRILRQLQRSCAFKGCSHSGFTSYFSRTVSPPSSVRAWLLFVHRDFAATSCLYSGYGPMLFKQTRTLVKQKRGSEGFLRALRDGFRCNRKKLQRFP